MCFLAPTNNKVFKMLKKLFIISLLNSELVHHHVVLVHHQVVLVVHPLVICNHTGLVLTHHRRVGCVGRVEDGGD